MTYMWLQKTVCKYIIRDLKRAQEDLSTCIVQKAAVQQDFTDFKKSCYGKLEDLHDSVSECYTKIGKAQKDTAYWMGQANGLRAALRDAIQIPDLAFDEALLKVVKPGAEPVFQPFDDFVIADEYADEIATILRYSGEKKS